MTKTERLFELIQILRCHRYPVSGAELAQALNISLRTLYRDIASLQAQGAQIEGEPGIGYLLKPGFMLPPMMFLEEELEALVLGSRWVANRADCKLQQAAANALAKISAVLPDELRQHLNNTGLLIGPGDVIPTDDVILVDIRQAIRQELKLTMDYQDGKGDSSQRTIWPIGLGYFDQVRILIAWCELRQDFRHFRTDRIAALHKTKEHYPQHRLALLKKWRITNNIPEA